MGAGLQEVAGKIAASGGRTSGIYRFDEGTPGDEEFEDLLQKLAALPPWEPQILLGVRGLKYEDTGLSPKEQGLTEQRQELAADIGRIAQVPTTTLGDDREAATARAVEEQNRQFLNMSIIPQQNIVGQALRRGFIPDWHLDAEPYEIVWDHSAFTRASTAVLTQHISKMVQAGVLSANEGRKMLDLPPREGGDEFVQGFGGNQRPDNAESVGETNADS